jgi:GT2 family glycosyltransferase
VRPVLSFIVPVRNDAIRLRRCLESMQSSVPYETLVVDNGSTDGSADVARELGAQVLVLPNQRVAALRNEAARHASADLLAFVDADHELGPGWAETAVTVFREEAHAVAAGAPYHAPPNGTWVQRMYDRLRRRPTGRRTAEWLPSGNLIVRRATFEAIGGFDTTLETCEDVDLCQRIAASGGTILECAGLVSVHRGDPGSLRALFLGELWRGRDNLRVTLRSPLGLRALASLLLPLTMLAGASACAVGLIAWPWTGSWIAIAGACMVGAVVLTRAATLVSRVPQRERTGRTAFEAVLVGSVYDAARAIALVARPTHDVRRRG